MVKRPNRNVKRMTRPVEENINNEEEETMTKKKMTRKKAEVVEEEEILDTPEVEETDTEETSDEESEEDMTIDDVTEDEEDNIDEDEDEDTEDEEDNEEETDEDMYEPEEDKYEEEVVEEEKPKKKSPKPTLVKTSSTKKKAKTTKLLNQSSTTSKRGATSKYEIRRALKGRRLNVTDSELLENIRSANNDTFLTCYADEIENTPIIKDIFNMLDVQTKNDRLAVASFFKEAFEIATIKCNLEEGTGVPFLNGKIYTKINKLNLMKAFGKAMKHDTLKLGHVKFTFDGGEYLPGVGLIYKYNDISELSISGDIDKDDENLFIAYRDSVGPENEEHLAKAGDVFSLLTGEKVSKKSKSTSKKKK